MANFDIRNGILFHVDFEGDSIEIPEGVKIIDKNAFDGRPLRYLRMPTTLSPFAVLPYVDENFKDKLGKFSTEQELLVLLNQ